MITGTVPPKLGEAIAAEIWTYAARSLTDKAHFELAPQPIPFTDFPDLVPEGIFDKLPDNPITVTDVVKWLITNHGWMSISLFNAGQATVYAVVNTMDVDKNVPIPPGGNGTFNMGVKNGITRVGLFCDAGETSVVEGVTKG